MIYLKDNKINKFGNNKIYLKDKVIYQAVKNEEQTITQPSYLKSAFAYDSFSEDGITDVITNTKYNWSYTGKYSDFNFVIKDKYNTIVPISTNYLLSTSPTKSPILKNYKSMLFKGSNIIDFNLNVFSYGEKNGSSYDNIEIMEIGYYWYGSKFYSYNDINMGDDVTKKLVKYVYIDFNGGSEESKILFLGENFDIIGENHFPTFNLSTNEDVGKYNSLINFNFKVSGDEPKPFDFYYQCYCDKFLSIDEIKEIDKYMMQR